MVSHISLPNASGRIHRAKEESKMGPYSGMGEFELYCNGINTSFWLEGMQFFNFIFLARSWAADRSYLASRLAWLGRRAEEKDTPLTFILYPEGTLVASDTRPISKKYADKLGIVSLSSWKGYELLRIIERAM